MLGDCLIARIQVTQTPPWRGSDAEWRDFPDSDVSLLSLLIEEAGKHDIPQKDA